MKTLIRASVVMGIAVLFSSCGIFVNKRSPAAVPTEPARPIYTSPFSYRASAARDYALRKGFSTTYCFLVDMSIHSGRKRFLFMILKQTGSSCPVSSLTAAAMESFWNRRNFQMHPGATARRRENIKLEKNTGGNTVSLTKCMALRAQTRMPIDGLLCCTLIVVFLMKKFIQELPATARAVRASRPLFLKSFHQLLTSRINLSFCGYINDRENHSRYSTE